MNFSSPQTPKPPTPLKILLMGEPGCRKTTLLLQFPDVHVLDCDRNLDGPTGHLLKNGQPNLKYSWDNIRFDDSGAMLDISQCYDRVLDILVKFRTDKDYQQRRVVGLDSLSHLNEFTVRKVCKLAGKESMDIRLWNDFASAAYTVLVAKLEQTGKCVVCTCHLEKVTEADKSDIMKKTVVAVNPLFSGKVGDNLGAFFTDVWLMELETASAGAIKCVLKTQRTPKCNVLKNSLGMPAELDITKGFSVIEPYLKGRI